MNELISQVRRCMGLNNPDAVSACFTYAPTVLLPFPLKLPRQPKRPDGVIFDAYLTLNFHFNSWPHGGIDGNRNNELPLDGGRLAMNYRFVKSFKIF